MYRSQGDDAKAIATLRQTLADYPEYASSHKELAELLAAAGKRDEALREYLASADINPFDPEVQNSLATLYTASGNAPEAARRRRYERILQLGGSPTTAPEPTH